MAAIFNCYLVEKNNLFAETLKKYNFKTPIYLFIYLFISDVEVSSPYHTNNNNNNNKQKIHTIKSKEVKSTSILYYIHLNFLAVDP